MSEHVPHDETAQTNNQTPAGDRVAYDEWVERCANHVLEGFVDEDDERVAPKPYHDATAQEFADDLEARQQEIEARRLTNDDDEEQDDSELIVEDTSSVSWGALWEEFGFDSPDGAGNKMASRIQLKAALQCTDQSVAGSPDGQIREAVNETVLVEQRSSCGTLRGYAYVGGER